MIQHLYIKNFVLINELDLDFSEGFSAFTGETGAGKSILIDAISLLCGEKASSSMVSAGCDKAIIEGTFDFSGNAQAFSVLSEAGFDTDDVVICTREITSAGKSTARINHRVVTLSMLKELLSTEIDIHNQRDNAYLLNTSCHIRLLDEYLGDAELLKQTKDAWNIYHNLENEKQKILKEHYDESDLEFFRHQVNEIESAHLKLHEDEELEAKEKQYKAVKSSFEKLSRILEIYDNEISGTLYDLNRSVQTLPDELDLEDAKTAFNDSYYAIDDAAENIRQAFDAMDLSEEDINEMESRLYQIQKLKHKYGRTIADIFARKDELNEQIEMISHRNEYLEEMDRKISKAYDAYLVLAKQLSGIRKKGCGRLDSQIASNLKDLILPNAVFRTQISSGTPGPDGIDDVEFLVSMNLGEQPRPLAKTASGGELSRLMLGLKVIFTHLQGIQTVIFDEIDTGVSGPVATAIGLKMRSLGNDCQVFAVTHLAPVAACAANHYFVSKHEEGDRTHTYVKQLSYEEIIEQLAVISSGSLSETAKAAARELYERNQG
ncbi:MAG: DNA repair protein RecN [Erysipelotrichaceae bacterium]|nr:DNA repair protein RecN [Erysipelotrichaceae bacterium]